MSRWTIPSWAKLFSLKKAGLRQRRKCRVTSPALKAAIGLEVLEDRTLPSTYTVMNLADSGSGSLRDAISQANTHAGADTIKFGHSLQGSISLSASTGQLNISGDLTIQGPGSNSLTVSGNGAVRVFDVQTGVHFTLSGLTVADGLATGANSGLLSPVLGTPTSPLPIAGGGGLLATGAIVTVDHCAFVQNTASGLPTTGGFASIGGAIASIGGGALDITNTSFTGNQIVGYVIAGGGAIDADALTFTADSDSFTGNSASAVLGAGANPLQGAGVGGALVVSGGSTGTVRQCTFQSNQANGGSLGGDAGAGGAAEGGAIINSNISLFIPPATGGTLVAQCDTFIGNQAVGGAAADGQGGIAGSGYGGALTNLDGQATVDSSQFLNNQAVGGQGGSGGTGEVGGSGGGGFGGAIQNSNLFETATITVTNSTFIANVARTAASGNGAAGKAGGAGTNSGGGAIDNTVTGDTATLIANTFLSNQALGGNGGAGGSGGQGGAGGIGHGGAVSNVNGAALTIDRATFLGNVATGGAGGLGKGAAGGMGGNGEGGAISNFFQNGPGDIPGANANIINVSAIGNQALGGAGGNSVGGVGGAGGNGLGGAVFNNGSCTLNLSRGIFVGNSAVGVAGGSGTSAGATGEGIGGAIYLEAGGTVDLDLATLLLFADHASTSHNEIFGL